MRTVFPPVVIQRASLARSAWSLLLVLALGACTPGQPEVSVETPAEASGGREDLQETPVPEGDWRPHRLSDCTEDRDVSTVIERYLGICSEYYRDGSGSDGMIEMELGLADGHRHSLMLLTLGQLYLLAGQGDPDLLPVEGPAADVGNWDRNRARLLARAEKLLLEAAAGIAQGGWTVVAFALSLILALTGSIILLLYTVFLLVDFPEYSRVWKTFLPPKYRDGIVEFLEGRDEVFG